MKPHSEFAAHTEPRCHRCGGRLPLEGEPYDRRVTDYCCTECAIKVIEESEARSAATVNRRFKVVVCGDCKCQVRMLPDEGWQCSCCGDRMSRAITSLYVNQADRG